MIDAGLMLRKVREHGIDLTWQLKGCLRGNMLHMDGCSVFSGVTEPIDLFEVEEVCSKCLDNFWEAVHTNLNSEYMVQLLTRLIKSEELLSQPLVINTYNQALGAGNRLRDFQQGPDGALSKFRDSRLGAYQDAVTKLYQARYEELRAWARANRSEIVDQHQVNTDWGAEYYGLTYDEFIPHSNMWLLMLAHQLGANLVRMPYPVLRYLDGQVGAVYQTARVSDNDTPETVENLLALLNCTAGELISMLGVARNL